MSVVSARQMLATELGAPLAAIEVISFERAEWTDSCLGLGGPAESCLAVMRSGWRGMLGFDGQVHEVRTDEFGETVRIAGPARLLYLTSCIPERAGRASYARVTRR